MVRRILGALCITQHKCGKGIKTEVNVRGAKGQDEVWISRSTN